MLEFPIYYSIIAGLLISMIGTLPPGIITLSILDKTLSKNLVYGLLLGLGALIIELIQISVSFILVDQLEFDPQIKRMFLVLTAIIFILIGIYYFKKDVNKNNKNKEMITVTNPILLGAALSTLNLLAIPYWIFYIGFLKTNQLFDESYWQIIGLLLGAIIGTSIIFIGYAFLARLIKDRLVTWIGLSNYFIGSIFLGLGIYQLIQII